MATATITVELNGTATNPYHSLGLTQNPFPQLADCRWSGACLRLQSLGGDPIPHDHYADYIQERLAGFDKEFVAELVNRFRPGELVKFQVSFPI